MAKRHYIPVTATVPGVNEGQRALIRKVIRTALAAEGVDFPCEVDVLASTRSIRICGTWTGPPMCSAFPSLS